MKYIARIAILAATSCVAVKAAPFMAVGDNAELFVEASGQIQADSNVFLKNQNEVNDTIYSFTPGVDLVFGKASAVKGNAFYREEMRRYDENDSQNTSLSAVGVKSDYSDGKTKVGVNASYSQLAQNDRKTIGVSLANVIVHSEVTDLGAKTEFALSEKTSLSAGITYKNTDYAPAAYSDVSVVSLPFDMFFQQSPKLAWSLGYVFTTTDASGAGADSDDNFFNVGARGEFSPKLTGQVHAGYSQRSISKGADQGVFGFDTSLDYKYSDKTTFSLTADNGFDTAATGESTKSLNVGLNGSTSLSDQWSVSAGIVYGHLKYPKRSDDYTEYNVGVKYAYNSYANFTAAMSFKENASDLAISDYTQNLYTIGANIKY